MKVAFFHSHKMRKYDNKYYSIGGLTYETLKRYLEIGDKLTVSTRYININNNVDKYSIASGDNIEMKPYLEAKGNLYTILNFFKTKKRVKKIISETNFVVARLPSLIGNIAIKEAVKQNKKYLIEIVGSAWDSLWNYSITGKILAPFLHFKTKKVVKNAPFITYVTNSFLQREYPSNGEQLACPNVMLMEINESNLISRIEKIENLKKYQKIILGTIAAIDVKYKRQEDVIKAIAVLNKNGYNFEYEMIGGGNSNRLQKIAKKYGVDKVVRFLGLRPHEEIFKWLKDIDIYIQPSKTEGLPRALIEAMSMGCPCIGTTAGGMFELLDKNKIFKKGNYKELIKKLEIFSKNEMKKQAEINFIKSKEYEKDKLNEKRNEFYKNIVKECNC